MKVIQCKQCKKELNGGFYNTPYGTFCSECWESKSKKIKDKALADTLKGLSMLGKSLVNNSIK